MNIRMDRSHVLNESHLYDGAVAALRHAGNLVREAIALFEAGSNSTAVVLAIFAREEMGRAHIILEKRRASLSGETITVNAINESCSNHVEKLRQGVTGFYAKMTRREVEQFAPALSFPPNAKVYQHYMNWIVEESKDWHEKRNPEPNQLHETRMEAHYVFAKNDGTGWNNPFQFSRLEAKRILMHIAGEYFNQSLTLLPHHPNKPADLAMSFSELQQLVHMA